MSNNVKALSTIVWIILILCSVFFGALLSYLWVMGNFYAEPENTVDLIITNAVFKVEHADYFNITVMNPSHSVSSVNITMIYFTTSEQFGVQNVTDTSPEKLPIFLERGTSKSIKCTARWGRFSGEVITVHVSATNSAAASKSVRTALVDLEALTFFDAAVSVKYFNVSITNNVQSAINLTLTNIYLDNVLVSNTSLTYGTPLLTDKTVYAQCFTDWHDHSKPNVEVHTQEGYVGLASSEVAASVGLQITDVEFNTTDPNANSFTVTLSNAANSAASVDINKLVLMYENRTRYTIDTNFKVLKNNTATATCTWPWKNYRNKDVNITAYTKQGFVSESKSVKTPQSTVLEISPIFNMTRTSFFLVNVTNMPCSLQDANVTGARFNQNVTTMSPAQGTISAGGRGLFNCTWNWANLKGQTATITVIASGMNQSKSVVLPAVDLRLAVTFNRSLEMPYANVTITNTAFSNRSVTIKQVVFATNVTYTVDGTLTNPTLYPNGYVLYIGQTITIGCPWGWTFYHDQDVTVTVQTKEGFTVSQTFHVP